MKSLSSILVGIDFTPGSRVALAEALRIARWNRASVRAAMVIDTLVAIELEEALSDMQRGVRDGLVADARKAWAAFAATVDGAVAVPLEVRVDNLIAGILGAAREVGADLLVLGASGLGQPEVGMGTLATACVRHAMCPVLLVRDTKRGPFRTVVACVDFSPTSLLALDQAARVATQDSAALHVLHVFDPPWRLLHYRAPAPDAEPQFQQQYRQGLERRLRAFTAELGREIDYLKPTFSVFSHGGHRSGIVEYAAGVRADLIVLGTRGKTNLRDVFLGTTAEKTLRDTPCSVLAIKPEGFSHPLATGEGVPPPLKRDTF
jgi:nucleotide-binding universal stress UspA family protein